jgi:hypothetical protein
VDFTQYLHRARVRAALRWIARSTSPGHASEPPAKCNVADAWDACEMQCGCCLRNLAAPMKITSSGYAADTICTVRI